MSPCVGVVRGTGLFVGLRVKLIELRRDLVEAGELELRNKRGCAGKRVAKDERTDSIRVGIAALGRRFGQELNATEITTASADDVPRDRDPSHDVSHEPAICRESSRSGASDRFSRRGARGMTAEGSVVKEG